MTAATEPTKRATLAAALADAAARERSSLTLLLKAAEATKREGMTFERAMNAFAVALVAADEDQR